MSVVCLLAALAAGYGFWKFDQFERFEIDLPPAADGAPQNFLVVGSDSREFVDPDDPNRATMGGDQGPRRADSIVIARVHPRKQRATLLSLPRDLWVEIAGTGRSQRINTAYSRGQQVLADTIQLSLGIPIHHYVEVDFNGFQQLVGAVDGVPMYFDRPLRDRRSGLLVGQGCVTLDGVQALAFARARKLEYQEADGDWISDPTADLGRVTRQQLFVKRAVARAVDHGLTDPLKLTRLVDAGVDNVGVDDGLSARDLLALGRRFERYDAEDMITYTLPTEQDSTDGGASILRLDEDRAQRVLNVFRSRTGPSGPSPVEGKVAVLNGSGVAHQALDVAGALERVGFTVPSIGNSGDEGMAISNRTRIYHSSAATPTAVLLGSHLTSGADLVLDDTRASDEVLLVTGRDFTTIEADPAKAGPRKVTTSKAPTSSTTTAPTPTEPTPTTAPDKPIGFVPGKPPADVDC